MGTSVAAAARDSDRLAADRAWARWGMAAAVTGMLAWLELRMLWRIADRIDEAVTAKRSQS